MPARGREKRFTRFDSSDELIVETSQADSSGAMEIARTQREAKAFLGEEELYLVGKRVTAFSPFQAPPMA